MGIHTSVPTTQKVLLQNGILNYVGVAKPFCLLSMSKGFWIELYLCIMVWCSTGLCNIQWRNFCSYPVEDVASKDLEHKKKTLQSIYSRPELQIWIRCLLRMSPFFCTLAHIISPYCCCFESEQYQSILEVLCCPIFIRRLRKYF